MISVTHWSKFPQGVLTSLHLQVVHVKGAEQVPHSIPHQGVIERLKGGR